jgi:hypothetical protein
LPYFIVFRAFLLMRVQAVFGEMREGDAAATKENLREEAVKSVNAQIANESNQEEVQPSHEELSELLNSFLDDVVIQHGLKEWTRQGIILTWGSLEGFVRDFFVEFVNLHPNVAIKLVTDSDTKGCFSMPKMSLMDLADYDFNLRSRLGELLTEHKDICSIDVMQAVFKVVFPTNKDLQSALAAPSLGILYHILVA